MIMVAIWGFYVFWPMGIFVLFMIYVNCKLARSCNLD